MDKVARIMERVPDPSPSEKELPLVRTVVMGVEDIKHTNNWPDLAIGLYDKLTGRNAEIEYEFSDLRLSVPSGTGAQAQHAEWRVTGQVKIRTRDLNQNPN